MDINAQNSQIIHMLETLEEKVEVLRQNSIYQQCQVNVHSAISKTLFIMLLAQDTSPNTREGTIRTIFEAIRATVSGISYTGISKELADYIGEQTELVLENELAAVLREYDALKAAQAVTRASQG